MLAKTEADPTVEHGPAIDRPRGKQEMPSIISEGIEIVGDMIAETEIQVDGTVRGNLKANRVVIGRTGMVDGSIKADTVTIDGTISGETIAKNAALKANARIKGGITVSGDMSVAAGARLEGKVTMKHTWASGKHDTDGKPAASKPNGGNKPSDMPKANKLGGGSQARIGRTP
jgi:cytoskeletal protein CcmA (bactofilin family)